MTLFYVIMIVLSTVSFTLGTYITSIFEKLNIPAPRYAEWLIDIGLGSMGILLVVFVLNKY